MVSVIFSVREKARGNVSAALVLWAIAMTVVLFMEIVSPSGWLTVSGFAITALLGGLLGWRRRMGAVFVAPFVSWLFAWLPMEIASMIHFGVLKGFLWGLVIITVGWIGIGFVQWVTLGIVGVTVRALRGGSSQERVVILDPEN